MDYSRFLSTAAPTKNYSDVWNETKKVIQCGKPLPYKLAFGNPNPSTSPFTKAKVTLKDGSTFDIDSDLMKEANQYGHLGGYQPLREHIKALTVLLHDPPMWSERDVIVTMGSLDALGKIFQLFVNQGDRVLIQKPCYHGVFVAGSHLQPNYVNVMSDENGIVPGSLREALVRCNSDSKGVPKFLYVNPGGSNPTGTVLSESRRRIIYDLACQYDFIIVEDDPYYFLQFSDNPPPTFLQLDTECRVIRIESFSKTLSAGMRLGYVIAPKPIANLVTQMIYGTYMLTSLLTQIMVCRLFDDWGLDQFLQRTNTVNDFYRSQRDIILRAADKHLQGLCEWSEPAGGFYLWLKVPKLRDTKDFLIECGKKRDVLLIPGCAFFVDSSEASQYMRASYASTNEEEVDKAFRILAKAIREEIKKSESR